MEKMAFGTTLACFLEEVASYGSNYVIGTLEGKQNVPLNDASINGDPARKLAKIKIEILFGPSHQIEENVRNAAPKAMKKLSILPTGATIGDVVAQTHRSFGIYRILIGHNFYTVISHVWYCEKTWGEEWQEYLPVAAEYEQSKGESDKAI